MIRGTVNVVVLVNFIEASYEENSKRIQHKNHKILKSFHSIAVSLVGGTRKLFTIFAEKISRGGFSREKCKGWLLFEDQFISSVVVIGGATRYWHKNRSLRGDINLTLPRKRTEPVAPTSVPPCKFHRSASIADNRREKERITRSFRNFSTLANFYSHLETGTFS